jgi:purine-binding chemotaxis protein CheW
MFADQPDSKAEAARSLGGKYLTFILGRASYGIDVLKIREIIRLVEFTSVPQMPDFVRGVINLRGKIIPVVDLRLKFRLSSAESTERTCIVVVQVEITHGAKALVGLVVDGVEEVVNIGHNDIEEAPDFGTKLDTNHILGMAKIKGAVKTLLDINRVMAAETLAALDQSLAHA